MEPRGEVLYGREAELAKLKEWLTGASSGKGGLAIVSGEAGLGKTALISKAASMARSMGFAVLSGGCSVEGVEPFLPFSRALGASLFSREECTSFSQVLVIDDAGLLVARASPEGELDADIFAGMLTAVQNFVKDSFAGQEGSLGRLEYGEMKILLERSKGAFLVAIFKGAEHEEMKKMARATAERIGANYASTLETWGGNMEQAVPIQKEAEALAAARFLVRRSLEGLKLDAERHRIADQVLGELERRSGGSPLMLVIEDLHWADESTLFVLSYLARSVVESKIAIVSTMRGEEGGKAGKAIEKLRGADVIFEVPILPLDGNAVRSLLASIYPSNDFPLDFPGRLAKECRGNPFFLKELVKAMGADGSITMEAGKASLVGEAVSVPSTIEEMAQRRLESLDPDSMTLAEYASCIGREFDVPTVLSLRSLKNSALAFEKLRSTGMVTVEDTKAQFAHALFQEATYKNISPRWKSAYHRSIGEHFESSFAGKEPSVAYELARHFAMTGEVAKTYRYCTMAGEKAEASYAPEQAARFYDDAFRALSKMPQGSMPEGTDSELLDRIGDARMLMSDFDKATAAFRDALVRVKDPEPKARLHRKVAAVFERKGAYDECLRECEEGLKELGGASSIEHAKLHNVSGGALLRKGDYDRAMAEIQKALQIAEGLGDASEVAQAKNNMGGLFWYMGDFMSALKTYESILDFRQKEGKPMELARLYNNLGVMNNDLGEVERARDYHAKSLALKEKIGDKQGMIVSLNNIGVLDFYLGDFKSARQSFKRCLEISRRVGDAAGEANAALNVANVEREMDNLEESKKHFNYSLEIATRIGKKPLITKVLSARVESLITDGEMSKAVDDASQALKLAMELKSLGDVAQCRWSYGRALAYSGRDDDADAEFKESLRIYTEIKDLFGQAKVRFYRSELLLKRGDAGWREELLAAREIFEKRRMGLWLRRCDEILSRNK